MKSSFETTPQCRFCRYYDPQGRRGGFCQMLHVGVEATWDACPLADPCFVGEVIPVRTRVKAAS
ncbi:MAG: hypothetical protein HC919_03515 [Oscillatoriales cyanobacterium SM2_2_1]|nr:hypothetical protein [Oscillatoriales cyanobacterium SM2_2_1]